MLKMPGSAVYKLAQEGKFSTYNVVWRQGRPKSLRRFREIFPSVRCGTRPNPMGILALRQNRLWSLMQGFLGQECHEETR